MFTDINEQQFSEIFVAVNQENIKQDLKIKYLDFDITKKIISEFITKHPEIIQKYRNCWRNKELYTNIINVLTSAQTTGVCLEMTAEQYADYLNTKLHKYKFIE
ncbi:MAG: hypothetical protein IJQ55_02080 [Alphaproteobacteria bacterium]|nr:hypothetical protein [Alphaproteobacteria bacterium]